MRAARRTGGARRFQAAAATVRPAAGPGNVSTSQVINPSTTRERRRDGDVGALVNSV